MDIKELKEQYKNLLQPVLGEQLQIDDSEEAKNWIVFILDGAQEDFQLSLYGIDCVHLYWCNECFIFDKHRNALVSSDTYGEIVYEKDFEIEHLPSLVFDLILQLKDCVYVSKQEQIKGKTLFGYDNIKDYTITAKAKKLRQAKYQLANITIEYIL